MNALKAFGNDADRGVAAGVLSQHECPLETPSPDAVLQQNRSIRAAAFRRRHGAIVRTDHDRWVLPVRIPRGSGVFAMGEAWIRLGIIDQPGACQILISVCLWKISVSNFNNYN
jgi:hypothetical protein